MKLWEIIALALLAFAAGCASQPCLTGVELRADVGRTWDDGDSFGEPFQSRGDNAAVGTSLYFDTTGACSAYEEE